MVVVDSATKIFAGLVFSLEFDISIRFKDKQRLRQIIVSKGGTISFILHRKCNYHVFCGCVPKVPTTKCRRAQNIGIPVLKSDFVNESVSQDVLLDPTSYELFSLDDSFSEGKIETGGRSEDARSVRQRLRDFLPTMGSPHAADSEMSSKDHFGDDFDLVKWCCFKIMGPIHPKSGTVETFTAFEVHRHNSQTGTETFRLARYDASIAVSHQGVTSPSPGQSKSYCYFDCARDCAEVYERAVSHLAKQRTARRSYVFPVGVGSPALAVEIAAVQRDSASNAVTPELARVADLLWAEAVGEVEDAVDSIAGLTFEKIDRAESLLIEAKAALQPDATGCRTLTQILSDFDRELGLKKGSCIENLWDIVRLFDLCQLLRDMVQASEATHWKTRCSSAAKLSAIGAQLKIVEPSTDEYAGVLAVLEKDADLVVHKVLAVQRTVEHARFESDLDGGGGGATRLFHGTLTSRALGVLSRGLLPVPVLAEGRPPAGYCGDLGAGIYFAPSASHSLGFTKMGAVSGERCLLIADVALGRSYRTAEPVPTLTSAPAGFDSVEGVDNGRDDNSYFESTEFAVYRPSQVRIRYLVMCNQTSDPLSAVSTVDAALSAYKLHEPPSGAEEDEGYRSGGEAVESPSSVRELRDPMLNAKSGLLGAGNEPILLKKLFVRAKLQDLAAEVTIVQIYQNESETTTEARYVFPLSLDAAVTGFEAYIKDRHVIGRVEEKRAARKEYKAAVEKGHGAYLMEEEVPNVFTVNIGNLPPRSKCGIKITYIVELATEGELIKFTLPSSVAPWERSRMEAGPPLQGATGTAVVGASSPPEETGLTASISMPFPIRSIDCRTHSVRTKQTETKAVVQLCSFTPLTSRFELLIGLAQIHVPRMWVEDSPYDGGSSANMLVFYPEFGSTPTCSPVTAVTLLLDMSNSMSVTTNNTSSADAAKTAMAQPAHVVKQLALLLLEEMLLEDRTTWIVNLVAFGSGFEECFPVPVVLTQLTKKACVDFVKACKPTMGSTNLAPVLRALAHRPHSQTVNHVLLSDGHLRDGAASLALAREDRQMRLLSCCVSENADVNFLRSISRCASGAVESFDVKQRYAWLEKIRRQLWRAGQPSLTGVRVEWQVDTALDVDAVQQAPAQLGSVFCGDRIVVYGFAEHCLSATLHAEVNGRHVSTVVSCAELNRSEGRILHQLTARAVLRDWEEGSLAESRPLHEFRKRQKTSDVLELSKKYGIICSLTSFVAVEERDKDEDMRSKVDFDENQLIHGNDDSYDVLPYMGWQVEPVQVGRVDGETVELQGRSADDSCSVDYNDSFPDFGDGEIEQMDWSDGDFDLPLAESSKPDEHRESLGIELYGDDLPYALPHDQESDAESSEDEMGFGVFDGGGTPPRISQSKSKKAQESESASSPEKKDLSYPLLREANAGDALEQPEQSHAESSGDDMGCGLFDGFDTPPPPRSMSKSKSKKAKESASNLEKKKKVVTYEKNDQSATSKTSLRDAPPVSGASSDLAAQSGKSRFVAASTYDAAATFMAPGSSSTFSFGGPGPGRTPPETGFSWGNRQPVLGSSTQLEEQCLPAEKEGFGGSDSSSLFGIHGVFRGRGTIFGGGPPPPPPPPPENQEASTMAHSSRAAMRGPMILHPPTFIPLHPPVFCTSAPAPPVSGFAGPTPALCFGAMLSEQSGAGQVGGGLFSFGGLPSAAGAPKESGGLFGSAAHSDAGAPKESGGLFGSAAHSDAGAPKESGGLFGSAAHSDAGAPKESGGLFGSAVHSDAGAPKASGGLFGSAVHSDAGAPKASGGLFGSAVHSDAGAPKASGGLFGSAVHSDAGAPKASGGLFGSAVHSDAGAPKASGGLFGSAVHSDAGAPKASGGLFGSAVHSDAGAPKASGGLFGSAVHSDAGAPKGSGGIFGSSAPSRPGPVPHFGALAMPRSPERPDEQQTAGGGPGPDSHFGGLAMRAVPDRPYEQQTSGGGGSAFRMRSPGRAPKEKGLSSSGFVFCTYKAPRRPVAKKGDDIMRQQHTGRVSVFSKDNMMTVSNVTERGGDGFRPHERSRLEENTEEQQRIKSTLSERFQERFGLPPKPSQTQDEEDFELVAVDPIVHKKSKKRGHLARMSKSDISSPTNFKPTPLPRSQVREMLRGEAGAGARGKHAGQVAPEYIVSDEYVELVRPRSKTPPKIKSKNAFDQLRSLVTSSSSDADENTSREEQRVGDLSRLRSRSRDRSIDGERHVSKSRDRSIDERHLSKSRDRSSTSSASTSSSGSSEWSADDDQDESSFRGEVRADSVQVDLAGAIDVSRPASDRVPTKQEMKRTEKTAASLEERRKAAAMFRQTFFDVLSYTAGLPSLKTEALERAKSSSPLIFERTIKGLLNHPLLTKDPELSRLSRLGLRIKLILKNAGVKSMGSRTALILEFLAYSSVILLCILVLTGSRTHSIGGDEPDALLANEFSDQEWFQHGVARIGRFSLEEEERPIRLGASRQGPAATAAEEAEVVVARLLTEHGLAWRSLELGQNLRAFLMKEE